jgi:WD40 repeat protein
MKINVQKLYTLDGHQDCVYTMESGGESHIFYSAGGDGMVVRWDLTNPENGQLIAKMKNSVYALHYLSKDNLLIAGQNFVGIHLIDLTDNKEVASLKLDNTQIFDIKSYGDTVFVGTGNGILFIIDVVSLTVKQKIKAGNKSIRSLAVNTQLGEMSMGMSDNTIRILDLDGYKQKYSVKAHILSVFSVAYNPADSHLISVSRDAHLKSWNSFDHYAPEQSVPAHMFAINSISLSPDAKYFVTGSMDKSVKVWETGTFRLLKVIDKSRHAGHASSVNKVLWTNYKNLVLSCSDDKKISVWDLSFN